MLLRSIHRACNGARCLFVLTSASHDLCQLPQAAEPMIWPQQQLQQQQFSVLSCNTASALRSVDTDLHHPRLIHHQQQQPYHSQQLPLGGARPFSSQTDHQTAEIAPTHSSPLPQTDTAETPEDPYEALKQRLDTEKQEILQGMPGPLIMQPLFWNNLSSKITSRRPAIKYPARHQWRYCAEDYDPMEPIPKQQLPPYAPVRAHTKDYRKIYFQTRPQFHRGSYWRLWRKNVAIADQRWKQAWEAKLAAARKHDEKVKRLSERIIRERSWQVWQLQQQGVVAGAAAVDAAAAATPTAIDAASTTAEAAAAPPAGDSVSDGSVVPPTTA